MGHDRGMGELLRLPTPALPTHGEVFADSRGSDRALRVNWHPEGAVVVLSLWRGTECTGSFRLPVTDLPDFLRAITDGPLSEREPTGG